MQPLLSVVIPVYNEELILRQSVVELRRGLEALGHPFEIVLAQNGSRDQTASFADALAAEDERIVALHFPEPNYGGALRRGIYAARGRFIVCEEIDLCQIDFTKRSISALLAGDAQFVVGSKAMHGAADRRPMMRRLATRGYNGLLRLLLGYRGTDTHGLKAFVRADLLEVVGACLVEHDVFASELVIRAQRQQIRVLEIPIDLEEKRKPSIGLWRRVPRVLRHVARLTMAIRFGKTKASVPAQTSK